jgi:hypothetical protein
MALRGSTIAFLLSALGLSVVTAGALNGCGSDSIAPRGGAGGASGSGTGGSASGGGSGGASETGGSGGTGSGGAGPGGGGGATAGGSGGGPVGDTSARAFATKLGRPGNFLVGMGADLANNHDLDGAYTLGATLDLHYAYLVGLPGLGGWPDWNAGGTFVNVLTDTADKHGVVPMFTVYSFAAQGENRTDILASADFMGKWWAAARLLFDRLGPDVDGKVGPQHFGKPAVVHLEPDFWGYVQQKSGGDPAKVKVLVKMVPDCADLTDDLAGLGQCFLRLGRKYAPKAVIGFHASEWAGTPAATAAFLNAIGAKSSDFVATDGLDRDAGCFEAHIDPNCQRGGKFYLDETNATSPNFKEHLAFVKVITEATGRPMLWWQVPFGVPSATPGGTPGHYRDNRVHYMFSHIEEFIAAGFAGAAFGAGAANQTFITTDGGQFKNAVTGYFAKPVPLP